MKLSITLFLLAALTAGAFPTSQYTEFYCTLAGTNINSGHTPDASPTYHSENGNWDATAGTFTPTDGTTPASSVTNGAWAAVYIDGSTNLVQASAGGFVAMVTNVAAGANGVIKVGLVAIAGTAPTTSATGRTIRVGGSWRGAYGTIAFPFGFATSTLTNANNNNFRCNIQSTYSNLPTAAITDALVGPRVFQGYTSVPGDGGKFILDAQDNSFAVLTVSGDRNTIADGIFQYSGASSITARGLTISGAGSLVLRCVGRSTGGVGIRISGESAAIECEAYNCGRGGSGSGGLDSSAHATFKRCIAHNNRGDGFQFFGTANGCISASNTVSGFSTTAATMPVILENCDALTNKLHGFDIKSSAVTGVYIENCNFLGNGGFGIDCYSNVTRIGEIRSCYFGSGVQANALGDFSPNIGTTNSMLVLGSASYGSGVTPYVNYDGFNYTLSSSAASFGMGLGNFTDLLNGGGTTSYPSVGAAGVTNSATAGGGGGSYTFSQ